MKKIDIPLGACMDVTGRSLFPKELCDKLRCVDSASTRVDIQVTRMSEYKAICSRMGSASFCHRVSLAFRSVHGGTREHVGLSPGEGGKEVRKMGKREPTIVFSVALKL